MIKFVLHQVSNEFIQNTRRDQKTNKKPMEVTPDTSKSNIQKCNLQLV